MKFTHNKQEDTSPLAQEVMNDLHQLLRQQISAD